jgi:glycosyltransferase involved in cell wall biosynthesis
LKKNLSIITISYRDPRGLSATIKSLQALANSGIAWEHCVVDSSPVENQEILQALPANWPLRHLTSPARGVYSAQNLGIAESDGEVLWFLNGGDRLHDPKVLEKATRELLQNSEAGLWVGAVDILDGERVIRRAHPQPNFSDNLRGENRLCHQAVLYHRSVFTKIGRFNEAYRLAADYEHLLRVRESSFSPIISQETLVEFSLGGASTQNMRKTFLEFREARRKNSAKQSFFEKLDAQLRWSMGFIRILLVERFKRNGS